MRRPPFRLPDFGGDGRASQVPGEPQCVHALLFDPGGTSARPTRRLGVAFRRLENVGARDAVISGLNHTADRPERGHPRAPLDRFPTAPSRGVARAAGATTKHPLISWGPDRQQPADSLGHRSQRPSGYRDSGRDSLGCRRSRFVSPRWRLTSKRRRLDAMEGRVKRRRFGFSAA